MISVPATLLIFLFAILGFIALLIFGAILIFLYELKGLSKKGCPNCGARISLRLLYSTHQTNVAKAKLLTTDPFLKARKVRSRWSFSCPRCQKEIVADLSTKSLST